MFWVSLIIIAVPIVMGIGAFMGEYLKDELYAYPLYDDYED